MSSSSHFAFHVLACALLAIGLWGACAGIGYRIVPRSTEARDADEPASWRQPGLAACVGLAVLVMLGGIAVALRIPWWIVVAPVLLVGLVLAMWELRTVDFGHGRARSVLILGGIGLIAFGAVAVIESLVGLRFPVAACDDLRAYLPLARRLLDTNGLTEPWSFRRLQSLGGFTFLQALPVSVFGNVGIGVAETTIAGTFLAGLFVAPGWRTVWARVLAIAFIVAIPLLWVPRVNTTAVLMATPLLVALLGAAVELRVVLRARQRSATTRWALAGGLITALLSSARTPIGVVAGLTLVLAALSVRETPLKEVMRAIGAVALGAVLAIAPWSVALWQSGRTPFYPLIEGNANSQGPGENHASVGGVVQLAHRAFDLVSAGPYVWIALAILVLALLLRSSLPDASLVITAAAVVVVGMCAFAALEVWESRLAFLRYVAPMSEGLAIFVVYELVRRADERAVDGVLHGPSARRATVAIAGSVALTALAFAPVGLSVEAAYLPGGAAIVDSAARNQLFPVTSPAALQAEYERAFALGVPGRTIAAVDRPFLIDYKRYNVENLDLPGWAAPGGTFPFFTGPGAKVARLRGAGYDTLVATLPAADSCLSPAIQGPQLRSHVAPYARYARYDLDWENDVTAITRDAPGSVRRVGDLLVIDLARAQRELAQHGASPP